VWCSVLPCVAMCRTWISSFAVSDSPIVCGVLLCCGVLQCIEVCCSVLPKVALCCSVLQYIVVCCNVFHCVVVCCTVLQCVAECCMWFSSSSLLDSSTVEQQLHVIKTIVFDSSLRTLSNTAERE